MSLLANGKWLLETKGFCMDDARDICKNKMVVFIGDSLVRGMYKDLVHFLCHDSLLLDSQLKRKGEECFENDRLVEGGVFDGLFNGKEYIEVREFMSRSYCVRFYFVTRCYYDYMESILEDFLEQPIPDVVFVSSCLWDITRWPDEVKTGENILCKYKANLNTFFTRLTEVLPEYSVVIWGCCLPLGSQVFGGFMDASVEWQQTYLRGDVLLANHYASELAANYKYDIIDYNYFFRNFQASRKGDGIHWNPSAHRNMTFMFLYQLAETWGMTDIVPKNKYAVKMTAEGCTTRTGWFDSHHSAYQYRRLDCGKDSHSCSSQSTSGGGRTLHRDDRRTQYREERRHAPYSRDRELSAPAHRYSECDSQMNKSGANRWHAAVQNGQRLGSFQNSHCDR